MSLGNNYWKCIRILEKGRSTNSQFMHGTKTKTESQSRGNRHCGHWNTSQTGYCMSPILFLLYGEYLMKELLPEVGNLKIGGRLIIRSDLPMIRYYS